MNITRSRRSLFAAFLLTSALTGCAALRAGATESCSEDARIQARVQEQLDARAGLGAPRSIDVQSIGRVVYLSGLVDTGPERCLAESIATQTPGVARVVNSIEQHN
ncbi:MAG: BON domain-containing protein [Rudaea sp.]